MINNHLPPILLQVVSPEMHQEIKHVSTYTAAAHDTTDSCSELIGFTSTGTCSSK